jgi:hypothetical protein
MKLEWEPLDSSDPLWWTKTLAKGLEIQKAIESSGRNFVVLTTYDDETIFATTILQVEDSTVFLIVQGLSTQVPVRKIASMTLDAKAIQQWGKLPDVVSKETFVADWSRRGTFKPNPGWG